MKGRERERDLEYEYYFQGKKNMNIIVHFPKNTCTMLHCQISWGMWWEYTSNVVPYILMHWVLWFQQHLRMPVHHTT